jgi:hypothetical protein
MEALELEAAFLLSPGTLGVEEGLGAAPEELPAAGVEVGLLGMETEVAGPAPPVGLEEPAGGGATVEVGAGPPVAAGVLV